jgi:hypothetical protein
LLLLLLLLLPQWCDAHPDEPLSEVISLLPAALENPTRFAVTSLVATR